MKKIGIITFHRAFNYGAVLQAYALRQAIIKLGYDCEIIDYGNVGEEPRINLNFKGIKTFLASLFLFLLSFVNADIRRIKFKKFINKQIGISKKRYKTKDELFNANREYDVFIAGSDQVWNCNLTNADLTYFLDFVNDDKIKISYSASFGMTLIPQHLVTVYSKLIKRFNKVSVREISGQKIVKEIAGVESDVVLDPTLLLCKDEWDKISSRKIKNKKYILCFIIMQDPPGLMAFCKHIKSLTGYKIIRLANPVYKIEFDKKIISTAGPLDFISLIRNSSIIITNSFHGTAFAVLYEKPFYTFLYNNERDIRLKEIAMRLGLEERLINPEHLPKIKKEDITNFDFSKTKQLLELAKSQSLEFIKSALRNY